MEWNLLPISVEIDGVSHPIREKCDYRMVLDVIAALNDQSLEKDDRIRCALMIFYEDISKIQDFEAAALEMMNIINDGESDEKGEEPVKPPIMNWQHDFKVLIPPINKVLGCEVRTVPYMHWWTFLGGYMEIGECRFQNIINIRSKRQRGKKLDTWEQEFYRENKKMVDLPQNLTEEEKEWLDSDW